MNFAQLQAMLPSIAVPKAVPEAASSSGFGADPATNPSDPDKVGKKFVQSILAHPVAPSGAVPGPFPSPC